MLDEFSLIDRIRKLAPVGIDVITGIGDDCAVLAPLRVNGCWSPVTCCWKGSISAATGLDPQTLAPKVWR